MLRTRNAFLFILVLGLVSMASSGFVALPDEDTAAVERPEVLFSGAFSDLDAVVLENDTREKIRESMVAKLMEAFHSRPKKEDVPEPTPPSAPDPVVSAALPWQDLTVEEPLPTSFNEDATMTPEATSTPSETASSTDVFPNVEEPTSASSTEKSASGTSTVITHHATST